MSKKLTTETIKEAAKKLGYNAQTIAAIAEVEGNGQGFEAKTGRIIIQFEPGYFKRLISVNVRGLINDAWRAVESKQATDKQAKLYADWSAVVANKVEGQTEENRIFNLAFGIDPEAAMKSTSWGMGQIMGDNHKAAGFDTVGKMVDAFKQSAENQFLGMLSFIANNPTLNQVLKDPNPDLNDFRLIALFYNGKKYEMYKYHTRLLTAFNAKSKEYAN